MQRGGRFAAVLNGYAQRAAYTIGQLAKLSGLPKSTIGSWLEGLTEQPQDWHSLLRLAAVLRLSAEETSTLLQAAGHAPLPELRAQAADARERALLAPWDVPVTAVFPVPAIHAGPAPFQAIAEPPYFTGRAAEIAALRRAILDEGATLCVIQGMAGVGKTALATRLAYLLRPYFPDGVLWARVDAADVMDTLGVFAQAYGLDVRGYRDQASRGSVVRGLLAEKRALIVLDNVEKSQEAAALLPPTGACAVIVTTRRRNLMIAHGAYTLDLQPFKREGGEAAALLAKILGKEAAARDKLILDELADLLGHLPLALGIAACRLAVEPGWTAADFLARLRRGGCLGELASEGQSVRVSFGLSFGALPPEDQRFFTALGALTGDDFDAAAAGAVGRCRREEAENALRRLYDLSLAQGSSTGRYWLHPLLRDYARERVDRHARRRMVLHYLEFITKTCRDHQALAGEAKNIEAALSAAHELGLRAELVRGVLAAAGYFRARGMHFAALKHLARAETAAVTLGDTLDRARILAYLVQFQADLGDRPAIMETEQAVLALLETKPTPEVNTILFSACAIIRHHQGDFRECESYCQKALEIARATGEYEWLVPALSGLAQTLGARGLYAEAMRYYHEALHLARTVEDRARCCIILSNLGVLEGMQGAWRTAESKFRECLTYARDAGDEYLVCMAALNLGWLYCECGRKSEAQDHLRESLGLAIRIGHRRHAALALANLARLTAKNDRAETEALFAQAMDLAASMANEEAMTKILNYRGEFYLNGEDNGKAENDFTKARSLAEKLGGKEQMALALFGLARTAAGWRAEKEALRFGQESLVMLTGIGHHRASAVREWLRASFDKTEERCGG